LTTADDSRSASDSVEAWYSAHAADLRAFLIGVLRSEDLAAEVLQATFAKALEAGHTAREETIRGWLFRVAFHEAMSLRRKQKIHEKHQAAWNRSHEGERPDDRMGRQELTIQVRTAMAGLPPEQQQVVWMRIYEEKTFAEIARELGTPLGTVLTRMRLALGKLRNRLNSKDVR
jgi:RNA polymerase sigma-70 factor (ECF subfamily)